MHILSTFSTNKQFEVNIWIEYLFFNIDVTSIMNEKIILITSFRVNLISNTLCIHQNNCDVRAGRARVVLLPIWLKREIKYREPMKTQRANDCCGEMTSLTSLLTVVGITSFVNGTSSSTSGVLLLTLKNKSTNQVITRRQLFFKMVQHDKRKNHLILFNLKSVLRF